MSIVVKLTAEEEALLQKHGDFYRALDSGARKPTTPDQQHFVEVCRRTAPQTTAHETAYIKAVVIESMRRNRARASHNTTAPPKPKAQAPKKRKAKRSAKKAAKPSVDYMALPAMLGRPRIEDGLSDREQRTRMARESMRQSRVQSPSQQKKDDLLKPHTTPQGIPEHEEGFPQAGWFTDEDYRKLHSRYDGGSL
jgi:uncharacterized protein YifE (UPF0438 family)